MFKRVFIRLIILALLALAGVLAAYKYTLQNYWLAEINVYKTPRFIIASGTASQTIIRDLEHEQFISNGWLFKLFAIRFGHINHYKAGEYQFPETLSPATISRLLVDGKTVQHSITIPEGWVSEQVITMLNSEYLLTGNALNVVPDGLLLPETYFFSKGNSRQTVLHAMQRSMQKTLDTLWETRQPNLPIKNKEEALVLASIVEKETGVVDERRRVAGVFIKRLRKGMRLQSDPTANYGIYLETGELKTRLLRKDIRHVSAYNTYIIDALPPSPICNPGRASIAAVLDPMETDELYFVADGKGGHVFARTLREHNRNVANYYKTLK